MTLDYDDFQGMTIIPRGRMPYRRYKLTDEFRDKQMLKPQAATRDPNGTAIKRWGVQSGWCTEARGVRSWYGQCECGAWIYSQRDCSGPEYRGRGNAGPKGRWPSYCAHCREMRHTESISKRRLAKLEYDREYQRTKRLDAETAAQEAAKPTGYWYTDTAGNDQWVYPV